MSPDLNVHLQARACLIPRVTKQDYSRVENLSSNELHHEALPGLWREWLDSLGDPGIITRYPCWPKAVADVARSEGVSPDGIVLFPGSDEAIKVLIDALARTTGRLLLSWPNYSNYERYAAMAGIEPIRVPFEVGRYPDHLEALCRELRETPPATVVVTNPNGISGEVLGLTDMAYLATTARAHNHLLIVDEAYGSFSGVDHRPILEGREGIILLRSFSKGLGIAGVRIAALLSSPRLADYLARWNCTNPVSALSLHLLAFCLTKHDVFREIHRDVCRTREWLIRELRRQHPDWIVYDSAANFVLIDPRSPAAFRGALDRLREDNIVVKAFTDPAPAPGTIRVTVGERASLERVLTALSSSAESAAP